MKRYANPIFELYKEATEEAKKKIRLMLLNHKSKSADVELDGGTAPYCLTFDMTILGIELRDGTDLYAKLETDDEQVVTYPLKSFIGHDIISLYSFLWQFEHKIKFNDK